LPAFRADFGVRHANCVEIARNSNFGTDTGPKPLGEGTWLTKLICTWASGCAAAAADYGRVSRDALDRAVDMANERAGLPSVLRLPRALSRLLRMEALEHALASRPR